MLELRCGPVACGLVVTGLSSCFHGEFLQGQPCRVSGDCEPNLLCVNGFCGEVDDTFGALVEASNPGAQDQFGYTIALSSEGRTLVVGAPGEDSAAVGIDGAQTNDFSSDSGAAYVFTRDDADTWALQAFVKPPELGLYGGFGSSLALAGDGNTLAVRTEAGPSGPLGVLCIFRRSGDSWELEHDFIFDRNPYSSKSSVALSDDGNTLVADIGPEGAIHVYERDGAAWSGPFELPDHAPGGYAGATSVASSSSGKVVAVGYTGTIQRVYVFRGEAAWWTLEGELADAFGDNFGASVAVADDGETVVVGAPEADSSTTVDSGAVYVFVREETEEWMQQSKLEPWDGHDNDRFGNAIALSDDGQTLVAANSPNVGSVYMFRRDGSNAWTQINATLGGSDDEFGASVALSGELLAVGAPGRDLATGAVYVY